MLNTRFWEDNYVSNLESLEKLLFIYFISNPRISLTGIYEVPLRNISLDTGIGKEPLEKTLNLFCDDKKIAYKDGWLCVLNYPKYQNYESNTIKIAIGKEFNLIPSKTLDYFIGLGYPIDTLRVGSKVRVRVKVKVINELIDKNFEKFWSAYPKKISKKKSRQVFERIDCPLDEILKGLEVWKLADQWMKDDGQFIPHPTTWLNQERWKDEVSANKKNDTGMVIIK